MRLANNDSEIRITYSQAIASVAVVMHGENVSTKYTNCLIFSYLSIRDVVTLPTTRLVLILVSLEIVLFATYTIYRD